MMRTLKTCQATSIAIVMLFSVSGTAIAAKDPALNKEIKKAQEILQEMANGHQLLVLHMNRAQTVPGIKKARAEGDKARKAGMGLVASGKKAIDIVAGIQRSSTASRKLRGLGEETICHVKSSIHNAHEGMIHTHHIHMVSGLRGGTAHIKDAVNHARVSATIRRKAEGYLSKMLTEDGSPDTKAYVPLPNKYCGLGEHAAFDKVQLDSQNTDHFRMDSHSHGEPTPSHDAPVHDSHGAGHDNHAASSHDSHDMGHSHD